VRKQSGRVLRGGSCFNAAAEIRSAYRGRLTPSGWRSDVGFRRAPLFIIWDGKVREYCYRRNY